MSAYRQYKHCKEYFGCNHVKNSSRTQTVYQQILIVFGFNDTSTLVGHIVLSPREREEIEEIVEEMKERDRGERGKWMKVKKQKK